MAIHKDYYQILGIPQESDVEGIKRAYRELAHKYHPDKNPGKDSHVKFMELKEAYEVLINPSKRKSYTDALNGVSSSEAMVKRYEQVRQKRATRYRRSSYQRRFTYRGNYSSAAAHEYRTDFNEEASKAYSESFEKYAEYYDRSEKNAEKGYWYLLRGLQFIFGVVFLVCVGLLIDLGLAQDVEPEKILYKQRVSGSFASQGVRISTDNYIFTLNRAYEDKFYRWQMIKFQVTPFRKLVSKVYVEEPRISYTVNTQERLGGFSLLLIWILLFSIPFLFWPKLTPKNRVNLAMVLSWSIFYLINILWGI